MKRTITVIFFALLAGCATKSKNIPAAYTSPLHYESYTCAQLSEELNRIGRKVAEISAMQDATATKDAVAMTVGMVVFWPALFFLAGGEHGPEVATLKGLHEALQAAAINKDCTAIAAH